MAQVKYSEAVRNIMRASGMTEEEINTKEVRAEQERRARLDPNHPANQPFVGRAERFMEPIFEPSPVYAAKKGH